MGTYQVKTYEDLINFVLEGAKLAVDINTVDAQTLIKVKRLINIKYQSLAMMKKWPWRSETRWLTTTPSYTTGTVNVTNGDRNITLSAAATVTDDFKGRFIRIEGNTEYYEIVAVNSTASRTMQLSGAYQGDTDAAASYTIWRAKYGLWPDFADIYGIVPMTSNALVYDKTLEELSWSDFIKKMANTPFTSSQYPTHFTVAGSEVYNGPNMGSQFIMGYDFMDNAEVDDPALWLFPGLMPANVLQVHYGKQAAPLIENSDEPWVPKEKRAIIGYMVLEDWALTQLNNIDLYREMKAKVSKEIAIMKADYEKSDNPAVLIPKNRRQGQIISGRISYNLPNE